MGFSTYRVGTDGSVWTKRSKISRGKGNGSGSKFVIGKKWIRLRGSKDSYGYISFGMTHDTGKKRRYRSHELVLFAFVGPRPQGMVARHFPDRNPENCYITNLTWSTKRQNMKDREFHKTKKVGEALPHSKLTESMVKRIRKAHATGKFTFRELASIFGSDAWHVITGKTWRHVK